MPTNSLLTLIANILLITIVNSVGYDPICQDYGYFWDT